MADPFDSPKGGEATIRLAHGEGLRLRELMREYQDGRFDAFDEIYASIAPALRRYLLSQARDGAKADDLVQETFLQLHRARHTYDPSFPLMPWAMAIARRSISQT
jgi:RNA polymerase sigma-70 factor, ECF subfamily